MPSAVQPCSEWNKEPLTIAGNGIRGNSSSQLNSSHQIAMDSSGKLYIYDAGNGRIQIFDKGSISTWRNLNEKLSGNCLFIDDYGTLYIENGHMKPIIRWTNGNVLVEETKCRPSVCANMFVDSSTKDIYITDNYNHHVIKCTPDGKQTVVAGMAKVHGTSVHQLAYPRGIFVDEENKDIFVADTMNDRIIKWSQNAKEGIIVYNISLPNSLIKDKNNDFYVADRSHRIVRINPYKREITTIVGESRNNSHYFSAT